jgi:hypothetical protein
MNQDDFEKQRGWILGRSLNQVPQELKDSVNDQLARLLNIHGREAFFAAAEKMLLEDTPFSTAWREQVRLLDTK